MIFLVTCQPAHCGYSTITNFSSLNKEVVAATAGIPFEVELRDGAGQETFERGLSLICQSPGNLAWAFFC